MTELAADLWKLLIKQYGIKSMKDLDAAINELGALDISPMTEKGTESHEKENRDVSHRSGYCNVERSISERRNRQQSKGRWDY